MLRLLPFSFFFFFNDTATTEIYTLSLHDALPISLNPHYVEALVHRAIVLNELGREAEADAAFRRAAQVGGEPRQGFSAHVAAKLANQHAALGDAYLEAGGLAQAIEQYQAALVLGPAFHDLRYKLGRMLLQAGRALGARGQFSSIVGGPPGHPHPP